MKYLMFLAIALMSFGQIGEKDSIQVLSDNIIETGDFQFGEYAYDSMVLQNLEFSEMFVLGGGNCTYSTGSGHTYSIMNTQGSTSILSRYGPDGNLEQRRVIDSWMGSYLCAQANQ